MVRYDSCPGSPQRMMQNNDTARFLLKVLAASLGVSILIKVAGPSLPLQGLQARSLNYIAIFLITLPSVIVGSLLLIKGRS